MRTPTQEIILVTSPPRPEYQAIPHQNAVDSYLTTTGSDWPPTCNSDEDARLSGSNGHFDFSVTVRLRKSNRKAFLSALVHVHAIHGSAAKVSFTMQIAIDAFQIEGKIKSHMSSVQGIAEGDSFMLDFYPHPQLVTDPLSISIRSTRARVSAVTPAPTSVPNLPLTYPLAALDNPSMCDLQLVSVQSPNGPSLHVSRTILANTCPFFADMLKGPWAANVQANRPVEFEWSTKALVVCVAHVYWQWLPDQLVPKELKDLLAKFGCSADTQTWTVVEWNEVMELAEVCELKRLARRVNRVMVNKLNEKYVMRRVEVASAS